MSSRAKYLLLIYSNPGTGALGMSRAERDEISLEFETLLAEIRQTGELVSASALADQREV